MRYLSLFSGIESATLAWQSLGWTPLAFSEIDPFCNNLLAHHFPDVPNLGDIKEITEETITALGSIDIIVFGSPCQDLSVAGKRSGLSGHRSGLFRKAIDIIHWAIKHNNLCYALWENVPGVFSSNQGKDFQEVLRLFTGNSHNLREKKKWKTSGIALGSQSLCEWRVLDAQHFGVPQRRRRVFAFVDFTENERSQPVLFECESLRRHTAPCRPEKEDFTSTAKTGATESPVPGNGICSALTSDKALTLDNSIPSPNGVMVPQPCFWDGSNGGVVNPAVCFQQNQRDELRLIGGDGQIAGSLAAQAGMKNKNYIAASFKIGQGAKAGSIGYSEENAPTLTSADSGTQLAPGLLNHSIVRRLTPTECERLQGLPDNWTKIPYRNKPAEKCPDTPRYRAIGNAMAVPVIHWIGQRIASVCSL